MNVFFGVYFRGLFWQKEPPSHVSCVLLHTKDFLECFRVTQCLVMDWLCYSSKRGKDIFGKLAAQQPSSSCQFSNSSSLGSGFFHSLTGVCSSIVHNSIKGITYTMPFVRTAVAHIVGPLEKNDLFIIIDFAIFTKICIKYYEAQKNCFAFLLSKKHMHAVVD